MSELNQKFDIIDFLFSAKGRLNRKPYNIFIAFFCLNIYLIFSATVDLQKLEVQAYQACNIPPQTPMEDLSDREAMCAMDMREKELWRTKPWSVLFLFLSSFLIIIPTIKRFHDRNKSGWWALGLMAVSFIPYISFVAGLWLIIEPMFLRGTEGPNDYGPDPLSL